MPSPSPHADRRTRPTLGVLTGWQFYHTATNLSYLEPVFRGISRAAQDLQCNVLLGCGVGVSASPTDPLRPAWPVAFPDADFVPVGPWNTDGLIIANPLHSPVRSEYIRGLQKAGHPVLFLGAGASGPAMVADNAGGILKAMSHLIGHGHRQIAFLAGSPEDMDGDTGARLQAYYAAVQQFGLLQDPRLIAFGRHVYDGGVEAMQAILASGVPFTAVLASNDESAIGAMRALREANRRIPEEVALIGFDNRPEGIVQAPPLTSVHVPLFDMGYHAVARLLRHLKGEPLPETITVETRLILRHSCGCALHQGLTGIEQATDAQQFTHAISDTIFSQAQGLTELECQTFSRQLVEAFAASLTARQPADFLHTLTEILDYSAQKGNDNQIWQNGISFLRKGVEKGLISAPSVPTLVNELINEARLVISTHIQKQHQQSLMDDRWASTQLSRLTAELLAALDETQVYEALQKHLPDMGIHTALLAFLESKGNARFDQCTLRNGIRPAQVRHNFPCQAFPPPDFLDADKPFHLTLIPMLDQGEQIGFVAFDTEHLELYGSIVQQLVSALKTVELYRQANEGRKLAEEANQMKSRFLSTISHELRTPLNLVVGLSGVLLNSEEDEPDLPPSARKDIERIHAYAQHLGGLIGDVLDLATSDAGRLKLNLEPLDLSQTLRMVATSGSQLAEDKGLHWEVNLPESGPWVMGDRTRLRQIALNLLNNAIKFTEKGMVSLSLEVGKGETTVYVRDTGMGISPEEQAIIFDEFYRSHRSVERGFTGLGLGLAICKRLVEMHGGRIGVWSSDSEGGGATFYFSLPTVPAPVQEYARTPSPAEAGSLVWVLTNVIETMNPFKQLLKRGNTSVSIRPMKQVYEWRTEILHAIPDLIVLDVSADPETGWHALSALKSNPATRNIPVMFYKSTGEGDAILNLDYLTKPIAQDDLNGAIGQLWGKGEPQARNFLVVEDDPHTLEMHARIVQSYSASNRVFMARDGREGLGILQQHPIDLILLDLQMPNMDGFAMLEAMRAMDALRDIPVIVITGKSITESEMKRLNEGVAVVLGKGLFNPEETVEHVAAALERRKKLNQETQRLVRAAMVYIHERYAEPITREEIANYIGITQDYLTFCFRQELGTTPIKYLRRYRVHQAKILLKQTSKTITEIAIEVGFSDSGYFSRVFRQETGVSPEGYRHRAAGG
ncbi:MAG: substrate-binding domain-containing protein [Anaerolineales bacterium]